MKSVGQISARSVGVGYRERRNIIEETKKKVLCDVSQILLSRLWLGLRLSVLCVLLDKERTDALLFETI